MVQWAIKQEIDLAKGDRAGSIRQSIEPLAYPGNANAHGWRVTVYNNGLPADLSGHTITAYFKRPDGNVVLVQGTVNNNVATVVLPAEVYALTGLVKAAMDTSVSGEGTTPLSGISFTIRENLTGNIIDPGEVIPATLEELLAEIDEMRAATAAANAAADRADNVDIAMTQSGYVITITTTDSAGEQTTKTITVPRASVSKSGNTTTITVTDTNGTTAQSFTDVSINDTAGVGDTGVVYSANKIAIHDLLTADTIPDTTQEIAFDGEGNVSAITHTRAGAAVRTDAFAFAEASITETRTLSTGQRLTLVTDLDTLATTATYAAA